MTGAVVSLVEAPQPILYLQFYLLLQPILKQQQPIKLRPWSLEQPLATVNSSAYIPSVCPTNREPCLYYYIMMNSGSFYKNNSPITLLSTFPQIIFETLELLLTKLIQLAQELQSLPLQVPSLPQSGKTNLINIYERKNIPTFRKPEANLSLLKNEFEGILSKLTQYKNSSSFDKKMHQLSPPGYNSFEYEEIEINLLKVEEELKKEIGEVRARLVTVEDDMGQILLLYKDLIFDK